ncbi:MAG: flavin monoamine oxidase family protein, partial [Leadbetterella sp.]
MRSAKTPLFNFLKKAFQIASFSNQNQHLSTPEVIEMAHEKGWSRRKFLSSTAKAGVLLGSAGLLTHCKREDMPRNRDTKVVIVGGGMAGLAAAHTFKKNKFERFTIFESSSRLGGRMYSAQNIMGQGLTTELGGEFIDSNHEDILNLTREFEMKLIDVSLDDTLIQQAFYFEGRHYTLEEVITEFQTIASQIQAHIDSLPDSITYESFGGAQIYDQLSITQYLESIGLTQNMWLHKLLDMAYLTEFGLPCNTQSAINLLFLISADVSAGRFDIFGESDERFKVKGGNQKITDKLASLYDSHIETNQRLTQISQHKDCYELKFDGYAKPITAEYVILTLPFTALRNVQMDIELPDWKKNAINNLGYGMNAKLILGFDKRHWRDIGYAGYLFADNGVQSGWDSSQLQGGTAGSFTCYLGGQEGIDLANGTEESLGQTYLQKLEEVYPNIGNHYNGLAKRFH